MEITFDTQKLTVPQIDEIIEILSEAKSAFELSNHVSSIFEAFEVLSPELYNSKEGKKLLKEYIQTVRGNSDLKKIYSFTESVHHTKKDTEATFFLNEALNICHGVNIKKYEEGEKQLRSLLNKAINTVGYKNASALLEGCQRDGVVDASIRYLASTKRDMKNLSEFAYHFGRVSNFITENSGKNEKNSIEESNVNLSKLVERFNETCKAMSKNDKNLVSEVANAKDKSKVFDKYKDACLETINESINLNGNNIDCDRLVEIKKRIENKTFNEGTLGVDVLNFIELQKLVKE